MTRATPSRGATSGATAVAVAAAAAPVTGSPGAPTAAASPGSPGSPAAGPAPLSASAEPAIWRRVPLLAWAVLGALAAGAYGRLGLGMGWSPPLVMTGLGGSTLVLGAAALWRVIDPLTRSEIRQSIDVRAPHRVRELEREKQAVLKAIKEIELDYQMRKISEPDYREMIERYRSRALRVMGDLAAGDDYRVLIERELKGRIAAMLQAGGDSPAGDAAVRTEPAERAQPATDEVAAPTPPPPAAPSALPVLVTAEVAPATTATMTAAAVPAPLAATSPERPACPACETANDPDARFCKKCGTNLLDPPASVPA